MTMTKGRRETEQTRANKTRRAIVKCCAEVADDMADDLIDEIDRKVAHEIAREIRALAKNTSAKK